MNTRAVGGPNFMGGFQRVAWYGLALLLLALTWMVLAVGLVAPARAAETETATVVIHVEQVSPRGGTLRLGLYDEARYAADDAPAVASADVPAALGETTVTLTDVAPGTYAIETFQDINSNGKMDTNWLGIPLEPFGFSRDAKPRLSKPGFDRVKLDVAAGVNTVTLHLQNTVSVIASK
jgi:uncharacterized protein (DUF2141 family)